MQSFEEFQKNRMAIDPTSRGLTDLQWEQSYKAYIASRERVKGASASGHRSRSGRSSDSSRRHRSDSAPSRPPRVYDRSSLTKAGLLRQQIQGQSAYQDLRLLINILAYALIGVVTIATAFMVYISNSPMMGFSALISGVLQVVSVIVVRLIVNVIIDIPDILLYRELHQGDGEEVAEDSGSDT